MRNLTMYRRCSESLIDAIGNTPLVKLNYITKGSESEDLG